MDIEKLIEETLTAHEHAAPDGDAVLTAARQRIERRRAVLSRPLAVAAGVTVLVLAAVTVVALNRPAPDEGGVAAPAKSTGTAPAPAKPAVKDLKMPYSLGWLPPGDVSYLARRINIGSATAAPDSPPVYGGEYLLTVRAKSRVLDVDVQQFGMMGVDEAAFKSGPGRPVTIAGQHAVESANSGGPGGYELYLAHAKGGTMYVNVSGGGASAQQLVAFGHRIAQNIRVPGRTTVTPTFGLRDLPGKTRMCAFDLEGPAGLDARRSASSTSYELGTCTTTMPSIVVGTNSLNEPAGTPGKPVQGHETRHADDGGYLTVWVLDAVKGAPVTISGRVPLENLYDIANHLVLPN